MRSFFHKDFHFKHKYPIKVWSASIIDDIPYSISFDGATLRQINLFSKKVVHSFDYHHLNAYSLCICLSTSIYKYENLYLLVKDQRYIEIYDSSLKHVPQFDYDTGSAIITAHWHKPTDRLFTCGTNGWLRCFQVKTKHKVTEFVAEWNLLWEIRSTSDWITSLAHDDFTQLLYGVVEDSLFAWDLNSGDFKYRLPQMHNKHKICQVDVDPESSVVITSGYDGYIRTWDIKELECKNLKSFEVAPQGYVSFVMIGRQIVTIGKDRIIKFYGVSDSSLRCSVPMADPAKKIDPEEVIIPKLAVLETSKGSICITSFNDTIQTAVLYNAPEDILSTDSTINSMDFDTKENELLCLCANNFVIATHEKGKSRTIDLDIPNTNVCKRSSVSEVLCFYVNKDILYAGFKNGSVKCINLRKRECIMLEQVPLDETIDYITIVHGLFLFNHPTCENDVQLIKTSDKSPFIVCYTSKGIINVWCARCYSHLLSFNIGKKPITCLKLNSEKSICLVSAQKTLTIYKINAYDFLPLGEITTSGNQIVTSFELTNTMELIVGTSTGEIMILQIEETEDEYHFHLKHHIGLDSGVFRISFNEFVGKLIICLKDGSLISMNQSTAKIINRTNHVDAEPLTATYFKYNENDIKVGVYLAFGSKIHFALIDTYEEPVEPKKEEEEEKAEEKQAENDDNEGKEEKIIKYFEESQLNIDKLMHLYQKEKPKKKRVEYIPEMKSFVIPQTQEELPINQKSKDQNAKLTFREVMEKNRNKIQDELDQIEFSRPFSSYAKKTPRLHSTKKKNSENNDINRQHFDNNLLNLTVTPFFYTDLPENSRIMVPSLKKAKSNDSESKSSLSSTRSLKTNKKVSSLLSSSAKPSNLTAKEKSLVYDEGIENRFQAIIDENDNVERTTPDYIPPGGRFILTKSKKEPIKAPTVIKKIFVGPPQSSRILFNDPSTLNGLSFFDPRGFQSRLEENDLSESSTLIQSSKSSSTVQKEEDNEEEKENEEDSSESEANNENEFALLNKQRMSDLDKRKLLKKRRVSITSMMTAPSKRSKSSQQTAKKYTGLNDQPFKPKPMQVPKTPQAMKNSYNDSKDNQNSNPAILITHANLEKKDQSSDTLSDISSSSSISFTIDDNKKNIQNIETENDNKKTASNIDININDINSTKNQNEINENIPQSPKHVQFVIPPKEEQNTPSIPDSPASSNIENEINEADAVENKINESDAVELKLIDIKLKHKITQRRKKLKNQPIHLTNTESTLASYMKNKIPEPEKFSKQKPLPPPRRTPPRDENESVKASMMSPKLSKKNSPVSSTSSASSLDTRNQNRKRKRKNDSKSNSGTVSETSSTIGESSESNLAQISQDDSINLPETQSPELIPHISKDEEQARINQERRKKMALGEDGLYDIFFNNQDQKKNEIFGKKENDKVNYCFPQLMNLQKFWDQNMVFPILPFEFGNPNTAKIGEGTVFDDSLEKINPVQNYHLFAGLAPHGINDLVRRFKKVDAFNRGERDQIDDIFDGDKNENILENLISFKRRSSF